MKRKSVLMMALTILLVLAVSGCSKPLFNVTENEDNTISITAENAAADSEGISYITAGENEILIAETDFKEEGEIELRIFKATFGEEDFPDEPDQTQNISGTGSTEIPLEPGEYTISVKVLSKISGTATLRMAPAASTTSES